MGNGRKPPNPQGAPKSWGKKPPAPPKHSGGRSVCDRTGVLAGALLVVAGIVGLFEKKRLLAVFAATALLLAGGCKADDNKPQSPPPGYHICKNDKGQLMYCRNPKGPKSS
jgi:hypothetical protein